MSKRLGPALLALLTGVGGFKAIPAVADFFVDVTVLAAALTLTLTIWTVAVPDRFTIPKVTGKPLLLLAALAPTVLWTSWSPYATTKVSLLFTVTLICLVAPSVLIQSPRQLRIFLATVAATGLVMVVASLSGFADPDAVRVTAFDASQLHLATAGGSLAVLAVLWGLTTAKRLVVGLGVAMLALVAVIGSGTRAAIAGALAALLVVLVASRGQGLRRGVQAAILIPAAGVAVLYGLQVAPEQARNRLEGALFDLSGDRSAAARTDAWGQTLDVIARNPFGVGLGDWQSHVDSHLTYPHHLLLEVGAEAGWLGLASVLIFLLAAFRNAWRHSMFTEGRMLLGLLAFLALQAMSRGDVNSHRLLFVTAAACVVLPRVFRQHRATGYSDHPRSISAARTSAVVTEPDTGNVGRITPALPNADDFTTAAAGPTTGDAHTS